MPNPVQDTYSPIIVVPPKQAAPHELPFTGYDVGFLLIGGTLLLVIGAGLRRLVLR